MGLRSKSAGSPWTAGVHVGVACVALMLASAGIAQTGTRIGRPGQRIDPARYLARRGLTVVEFSSAYCGACQRLAPALARLAREREDITLLSVDVNRPGVRGIDWSSPVVEQHGIESLPYILIYDAKGHLRASGEDAMRTVLGWLRSLPIEQHEEEPAGGQRRRPPEPEEPGEAGS